MRYDVYIDGQGYILDPEYGDKAYSETPQEGFIAKDQEGKDTFWQSWTQRSWHGGERQTTMLKFADSDNYQYHQGEGLVLNKFGEISLQPALSRSLAVHSASLPMCSNATNTKVFVGLDESPYIKWYDGTDWHNATSVTGSGTVTQLVQVGGYLYAIRGGEVLTSTDDGANWTHVTYALQQVDEVILTSQGSGYTSATVAFKGECTTPATATATVSGGAVTNITITAHGTGYVDIPSVIISGDGVGASGVATLEDATAANFTDAIDVTRVASHIVVLTTANGVIDVTAKTRLGWNTGVSIVNYKEAAYWLDNNQLWCWDGKTPYVYDTLPEGFKGTALFAYRQILFIMGYYTSGTGYRAAVYAVLSGTESHLCSFGDFTADHRMYAMTGADDEAYLANYDRGGVDRYDITYGGLTCGPAWGSAGRIPFNALSFIAGQLVVGRYDNVVGTDGVYVANVDNPSTFVTSGWLETSEFDFEFANDEKVLGQIGVYHRPLVAGQSVRVEYSLDGGTTWILAGLSEDVGTTKRIFRFANIRFDSIKVRLILTGPGTSTPTVRKLLVRACAASEAKWRWTMHVIADKVASRSGRVRKGYVSVAKLKETSNKQLPVPFVDRIGSSHNVVIEDCQIDQEALSKRRAYMTIVLRQL